MLLPEEDFYIKEISVDWDVNIVESLQFNVIYKEIFPVLKKTSTSLSSFTPPAHNQISKNSKILINYCCQKVSNIFNPQKIKPPEISE